jgi:hypothetical protein
MIEEGLWVDKGKEGGGEGEERRGKEGKIE